MVSLWVCSFLGKVIDAKAARNISPTFYKHFFEKSVLHRFYVLSVWVCSFLGEVIGAKAARKMLMKLTPGVNFINVLSTNFLYEHHFGSSFLVTCM